MMDDDASWAQFEVIGGGTQDDNGSLPYGYVG